MEQNGRHACTSRIEEFIGYRETNAVIQRFTKNLCKRLLVLFAQDVVEVAEHLPLHLYNAGIVIIVESRENLQQHREYQINTERLRTGLQWLLNCLLYTSRCV